MSANETVEQPVLSPGRVFAQAVATQGAKASVEFPHTITEAFPGFKRRPRIAVRALFKVAKADGAKVKYWHETPPKTAPTVAVEDVGLRPEAAFEFHTDLA